MLTITNCTHFLWLSVFFASACFFSWCIAVAIYRVHFHPLAKYPGPWLAKVSDLYGAYHNARGQLHLETEKAHRKYGTFVRQGPNKLVVNSLEGLNDLYYSKSVQKSQGYVTMLPAPGAYNVFTAVDKSLHRFKRKVLGLGFADQSVRSFEPRILNHVDIFVQKLKESKAEHEEWSAPLNMTERCRCIGYDVMGEFGFGQSFELQTKNTNHFLLEAVEATGKKAGVYVQYPRLQKLRLEKLFARKTAYMRERYLTLMAKLVKSRLAAGKNSQNDLFSFVIDAKDPETGTGFSESELWAESRFLLIAGADTSSTALTAIFFYLSEYPAVYQKLAAEIRSSFSSVEEIRSGPQLSACNYLRACIDEGMRMSPPISSTLWREICADGVFIDSHYLPPGTDIGVSPYALHHNESLFPESYVFKPERWIISKDNSAEHVEQVREAFSVFSIGSRACAGRTMAYTEISDILARTIWQMDFRRADGELGRVGGGHIGAREGRHRLKEFQLEDHITCCHNGPFLQFRSRTEA